MLLTANLHRQHNTWQRRLRVGEEWKQESEVKKRCNVEGPRQCCGYHDPGTTIPVGEAGWCYDLILCATRSLAEWIVLSKGLPPICKSNMSNTSHEGKLTAVCYKQVRSSKLKAQKG